MPSNNEEVALSSHLELRTRIQSEPGSNPSFVPSCLFHLGVSWLTDLSPGSFNYKIGVNNTTYLMGLAWDLKEIITGRCFIECVQRMHWGRMGHWLDEQSPLKRSPGKREVGRVRGLEVSFSNMPIGTVAMFLGSEISSVEWRQKATWERETVGNLNLSYLLAPFLYKFKAKVEMSDP